MAAVKWTGRSSGSNGKGGSHSSDTWSDGKKTDPRKD
jgi:hypothetical protein